VSWNDDSRASESDLDLAGTSPGFHNRAQVLPRTRRETGRRGLARAVIGDSQGSLSLYPYRGPLTSRRVEYGKSLMAGSRGKADADLMNLERSRSATRGGTIWVDAVGRWVR
jgi:hypothetical protein